MCTAGSWCVPTADDSLLPLLNLTQVALSAGNVAPVVDLSVNTAVAVERRRLFFAQAAADATEEHIKQWFSQYGTVESVQLFSEAANGISSGYGYVTMSTNEQAAAALAAVQQNPQLQTPVGFLNVSWPLDDAGAAAPAAAAAATSPNPMSNLVANAERTVSELLQLLFGKLCTACCLQHVNSCGDCLVLAAMHLVVGQLIVKLKMRAAALADVMMHSCVLTGLHVLTVPWDPSALWSVA
jgi:hypothetical protein